MSKRMPGRVQLLVAAACDAPGTGGVDSARGILKLAPELGQEPLVAALLGDEATVAAAIAAGPFATTACAPFAVEPLLYVCFSLLAQGDTSRSSAVTRVARLLLANGANPNASVTLSPDDARTTMTALVGAAAVTDNLELVLALLMAGADPNDGAVLIHTAARGLIAPLESLVAAGGDLNATEHPLATTPLHHLLDVSYLPSITTWLLDNGADPNVTAGAQGETALHVAVRRRRLDAADLLLDRGADIDARTTGGKTAFAHAARRGFNEIADRLRERGAAVTLAPADELAVALVARDLDAAAAIITTPADLVPSFNIEEARVLADLAGHPGAADAMALLLDAGASLRAQGLDGGTALHQAAWFGQPDNAAFLLERGAPLDVVCETHQSTPLGWVAHGSRHSGDAAARSDAYVRLARLLLDAGAPLASPRDKTDSHGRWLLADASEAVSAVLSEHGAHL